MPCKHASYLTSPINYQPRESFSVVDFPKSFFVKQELTKEDEETITFFEAELERQRGI